MSGPQHIAWYETAQEEIGLKKLLDLTVLVAPNEKDQFERVRDSLVAMSRGEDGT